MSSRQITRREALQFIAVTASGGIFVPHRTAAQTAVANLLPRAGVCTIMPETTEGPFYFDPRLVRRDITEGREGARLVTRLQVADAGCRPLPGARVDIWHCDAAGQYSGYAGQGGETFLRGTQIAGDDGIVTFETIYPGWYPGRTPHIHFKVFPDERRVMTGQLFFPDEVSRAVYSQLQPYASRESRPDRFNEADGIARRAGPAAVAAVSGADAAYEAELVIALDPNA